MTEDPLIKVNQARAGAIYEVCTGIISGPNKQIIKIYLSDLIFIRYIDPILLYYEVIAGNHDNIMPPLNTIYKPDYNVRLKEIKQQELPLYIHMPFKTKLFDNLLRGNNLKDKIIPSSSILVKTLQDSIKNPGKGQVLIASKVVKNFPDIILDNCFTVSLTDAPAPHLTRLI